ncbi:MAG: LptA/OstA family protein [Planctomycetota bacterium]
MHLLVVWSLTAVVCNGGEPPSQSAPRVKEEELERIVRKPTAGFPWILAPAPKPVSKDNSLDKTGEPGLGDFSSGDLILRALGDFSREIKQSPGAGGVNDNKEVLLLTKDVEIEEVQSRFVLRGQKIRVVRDLKTGQTELLDAQGNVEISSPQRSGRGATLVYETKHGPRGESLKDQYVIEGDRATGGRATLWQGDDVIEAEKFISDQRLGIFRALGRPVAIMTMPQDPKSPSPKPTTGGMLPGFSMMTGGGKIRLQADGEIYYESSSGRIHITRNVVICQEVQSQTATKMFADEVTLQLLLPPPGQPQTNTSMFGGALKSLECIGRVEVKTGDYTLLFDKGLYDMQRNLFIMEMKKPKDEVKIYSKDTATGGTVLIVPKRVTVNLLTGELNAGGPTHRGSFEGAPPTNRPPQKKLPLIETE